MKLLYYNMIFSFSVFRWLVIPLIHCTVYCCVDVVVSITVVDEDLAEPLEF